MVQLDGIKQGLSRQPDIFAVTCVLSSPKDNHKPYFGHLPVVGGPDVQALDAALHFQPVRATNPALS